MRSWFSIFLFALLVGESPAAFGRGHLPVPSGLQKDVKFWEGIFGKYKASECVFHDSWNLDVVYGIHRMGRGNRRQRNRRMERRKRQLKSALRQLSRGRRARTKVERQVYAAIPKKLRHRRFYQSAVNDLRCQQGIKEHFGESVARSKRYLPMIRREVRLQRLPRDIAYLPHLESGFHPRAHSKVGARGLWQFMPDLARESDLRVSRWRDDRLNPKKSTRAALRYIKKNYKKIQSWPLALTGYNYGINGIRRGVKRLGTNNFVTFVKRHRSPIFGFAARNFYPSFIAVRNLAKKRADANPRIRSSS